MAENLKQYISNKVEGSVLATEPFPFLYIQDFFPEDFYVKLKQIFPTDNLLSNINDKKIKPLSLDIQGRSTLSIFSRETKYSEIAGFEFQEQAIQFRCFCRDFLVPLVASKINVQLPLHWDDDTRFVLDTFGYLKRPHTDHPGKLFSILIYMSDSNCGTTILKPKVAGFEDSYGYDHKYDMFEELYNPPFVPNALLAFPRTNNSFHCVKRLGKDEYRQAIHINIRASTDGISN